MNVKPAAPTTIPAKMWNKLIVLARMHPSPKQFYEKAVELGREYNITEKQLIRWGTIDPHHKPKITEEDIVAREARRNDPTAEIFGKEKP